MYLCFLHEAWCVGVPAEVIGDVNSQELEARDTLHFTASDVQQGVWVVSAPPVVYDELLGLLGLDGQVVVSTPSGQIFYSS